MTWLAYICPSKQQNHHCWWISPSNDTPGKAFFGVLDFCTKVTVVVGFILWTTASKNLLHFHYANIIKVHLKMFRGLYTTQK